MSIFSDIVIKLELGPCEMNNMDAAAFCLDSVFFPVMETNKMSGSCYRGQHGKHTDQLGWIFFLSVFAGSSSSGSHDLF